MLKSLARFGAAADTAISPVGVRIPAGRARQPHAERRRPTRATSRAGSRCRTRAARSSALLAGAKPGEQVLDLCAGAGGKTLAMAAAMGNKGQIFAYDSDRHRLAPIYDRLKRNGVRNVQVRAPGDGALDDLVGKMDRVVIDAPCTGSGTWRRRPDAKWKLTRRAVAARVGRAARDPRRGAHAT